MEVGEVALPQGWQYDGTRRERTSGQATVFPVLRTGDQHRYALKRLSNPKRRARFQREVQTMVQLRDRGVTVIPEVITHDLDTEKPYFVMPWYDESLTDRIERRAYTGDPVAGIDVGIALAEALEAIHRHGYAHRDVKPDNIFFDGGTLLLGDFGLCLWADDDMRLTESAEAVGSRYFIAPENEGGINESTNQQPADFYAFGKVLWCILAGRRPLPREQQLRLENQLVRVLGNGDLARLDPLFQQLLDADPRSRLSDSNTVIRELQAVRMHLAGEAEESPQSPIDAAIELVRKMPQLSAIEQISRDRQRRDEVANWLSVLAKDVAVTAHEQFTEPCQRLTEGSGGLLQVGVSSGGHDPRQLFALQPALSIEGLDLDQGWPWATDYFALVQFLAFGGGYGLPSLRAGVYPIGAESGLWLLPIPDLEVGPMNERLIVPEFLLVDLYAPVGPLPYLLEQTRVAALNMARETGNWFLDHMLKLVRAIVENRDILVSHTWQS
jgi:serine/threonine protein kinase